MYFLRKIAPITGVSLTNICYFILRELNIIKLLRKATKILKNNILWSSSLFYLMSEVFAFKSFLWIQQKV